MNGHGHAAATVHVLRIEEPGFGTTLQDDGRIGFAHLGVPRAGPVDRSSASLANRLVGNPAGATVIETLGGLVVSTTRAAVVATPEIGRRTLAGGETIRIAPHPGRRWTHVAIRGGVIASTVLGSMCQDTLSGLGPSPLGSGTELLIGDDPRTEMPVDFAPTPHGRDRPIRLWPGPIADRRRVDAATVDGPWTVTHDVSRVGIRLRPALRSSDDLSREVATEEPTAATRRPSGGLVVGAVQLTPSGEVIVMLADHPTTGGYPVIGVVDRDDVDRLAQAAVGAEIEVRWIDPGPHGLGRPTSG